MENKERPQTHQEHRGNPAGTREDMEKTQQNLFTLDSYPFYKELNKVLANRPTSCSDAAHIFDSEQD